MRFRAVLIDIDNTLFDFRESSYASLVEVFKTLHFDFTREDFKHYEVYNDRLWQQFERGEIEQKDIYCERFRLYLNEIGLTADPADMNKAYVQGLAKGYHFMPHCRELLETLHGRYKVFAVTNGDAFAQQSRIARSGMAHLFDAVFISELVGAQKPERAFFDKVFATVGEEYRSCSIIVGDSLSSDMQGGRNAGIPTCFYGRAEKADDRCDYVIRDLMELPNILDGKI